MADLEFASLRHEISHYVHDRPLSAAALMDHCKLALDRQQLADAIYAMCGAGQLDKHPAPEGSGTGVRWIYGPGKVKLGAIEDDPSGGGGATPPKARGRVKRPKKRIKGVQKVQRKTAKRRRGKARASIEKVSIDTKARLWALRSDGAFMLVGTPIEIPRHQARALVDFVRTLDAGDA